MRVERLIALRHVRALRRRKRVSLAALTAALGVTVGVAALVTVLSVMNGFAGMIWDRLLGINAHITVRKAYSGRIEDYRRLSKTLAAHEEVVGASAFIQSEGFVLRKPPWDDVISSGVLIRGVDEEEFTQTSEITKHFWAGEVDLGRQETEGGRSVSGVLIGRVLADKLGAILGSEIHLGILPKEMLMERMPPLRPYRVTGIFNTGHYEFDSILVFISLPNAQRDLNWEDVVNGIRLRLKDPFSADRVGRELRDVLKEVDPSVTPSSWMYEHGNLYVWIKLEKWFMFLALSLIVVVACFNIISILTMNVAEHRREIGILKTMGMTPKSIGRIFSIEGLTMGAAGVVLGNLLGFVLCWVQQHYQPIRLPGDVFIVNALPVEMRLVDFVVISVSALILCYLFSLLPSRDAASLDPVEAIRYE